MVTIPLVALLIGCATLGLAVLSPVGGNPPLYLVALLSEATPGRTPSVEPTLADTKPPATPESPVTAGSETPVETATPADTPTPLPTPDGVMREVHVPILMYHYVSVAPTPEDVYRVDLSTTPDMFYRQMRWLKENGYNVISLEHLMYYLDTGWPELPPRPIVLTFDDGYVDNYTNALPVLQKFGFTGTFFVLTDVTDRREPGYMTWEMLREMRAAGMDIQVHGREHQQMTGRDRDWLIFHLLGPAQTINANLGYQPRFLAYPSGHYDDEVIDVAREMGYWAAVTTTQGSLQSKAAPFEMRRLRVRGDWDLAAFAGIVQEYSQ